MDGNVFIHSDAPPFATVLTKVAPNGATLGQITLGGINPFEFGASRLDRDLVSGQLLLMIEQIVPHSGAGAPA